MSTTTAPRRTVAGMSVYRAGWSLIAIAAFLSFVLSVSLWFAGSRQEALFVGLWVPSILSLGSFQAALVSRDA